MRTPSTLTRSVPTSSGARRSGVLAAAAVAGLLVLTGCGSSSDTATASSGTSGTGASPTSATPAPGAVLTLADGWVKAAPSGMTAMFGSLKNTGSSPVTVVGGSSSIAGMVETHEVVMVDGEMQMRPKAGGFVIEPGGSHELAPGKDHIMLMNLKGAVKPGDEITVDLKLGNGSTVSVSAIAKDFAAGNESYQPSPAMSATSSMSGM